MERDLRAKSRRLVDGPDRAPARSYFKAIGLTDEDHGPGMKGAQNHAWSDIDHDGDLDLLIGARDQGGGRANLLFRNDTGSQNHVLALTVEGDGMAINRDAIGTRVTVTLADGSKQIREVKSTRGTYNGSDTRVLMFGLGAFDQLCHGVG